MKFLSRWEWFQKRAVTFAAIAFNERINAALKASASAIFLICVQRLYPDLAKEGITMPELSRNGTYIEEYREPVHRQCLEMLSILAKTRMPVSAEQWNATIETIEHGHFQNLLKEMRPLLKQVQRRRTDT